MSQQQPDLATRADSPDLIRRSYALGEFKFRDNPETGGFTFEGTAAVVDHAYPVRDQFGEYTEIIRAGAFNKTLKDMSADVSLYVNHRHTDVPLATRAAGTLRLAADPNLRVIADLDPARPDVQIIRSAITRGEMNEMSIGFRQVKTRDKWSADYSSVERSEVNVRETSIVERGANTGGTTASMRTLAEFIDSLREIDMDAADIERAIAYFESRRPTPEIDPFAVRDQEDLDRLERLRRPAA